MMAGLPPGNLLPTPNGSPQARGRVDAGRTSAPDTSNPNSLPRDDLRNVGSRTGQRASDEATPQRRVEARRAAEDARLESFRDGDLPLPTARALSTFANVAAADADGDDARIGTLTGIDIRV